MIYQHGNTEKGIKTGFKKSFIANGFQDAKRHYFQQEL